VKLTATPQRVGAADLAPLRAHGLSDTDIHDLVQVIAYFNYITRVAEGLGTDAEPDMPTDRPDWAKKAL
jgi:alkylhydroperoxidase family enzyme